MYVIHAATFIPHCGCWCVYVCATVSYLISSQVSNIRLAVSRPFYSFDPIIDANVSAIVSIIECLACSELAAVNRCHQSFVAAWCRLRCDVTLVWRERNVPISYDRMTDDLEMDRLVLAQQKLKLFIRPIHWDWIQPVRSLAALQWKLNIFNVKYRTPSPHVLIDRSQLRYVLNVICKRVFLRSFRIYDAICNVQHSLQVLMLLWHHSLRQLVGCWRVCRWSACK